MNKANEPHNHREEKHFGQREKSKYKGPKVRLNWLWFEEEETDQCGSRRELEDKQG